MAEDYLDRALGPDDVLIDTGAIYTALTGSTAIPSSRPAVLALAAGLRATAIRTRRAGERLKRHRRRTGLTARGRPSRSFSLRRAAAVKVLQLDREEACQRIRRLVTGADRVAACETGLDRFYGRYVPSDTDEVVR